jgi:ubiquinone/menaquinone biosynthesis C-methylase UbiE
LTPANRRETVRLVAEADVFKHATPVLYDRYMGPLLFEPYAKYVAERVASLRPDRILETAAGTGIVTRAVSAAAPEATIVATDVNPAVVQFAAQQARLKNVAFEAADAQDLPYDDASFDLVLCVFGIMFFPDKPHANAEARRVLRPGGRYVVVTFDRLDLNPVPKAAGEAVATLFTDDPRYMERGPFSYTDATEVQADLETAGFDEVDIETVGLWSRVSARDAARGIVLGSPFRGEIERIDGSALERATAKVEGALSVWDGAEAPISAHVATAVR